MRIARQGTRTRELTRAAVSGFILLAKSSRRRPVYRTAALTCVMTLLFAFGAAAEAVSPADLAASDPGARVDGNTVVVTGHGATVFAVPDRPDFIAALGSGETVIGGGGGDQLGALGSDVTIRGGNGDEVIYGGPDSTLIGGTGHDLLVDAKANATVVARSGDEVAVSGPGDRVDCSAGERDVLIYRGASDVVSPTCRSDLARVLPVARLASAVRASKASAVQGDGSNDSPFTASCDNPGLVDCTVSAFPSRRLTGLWANEYVPAYKCPSDHPYLRDERYVPDGVVVPKGVEIQEGIPDGSPWPIGIFIGNFFAVTISQGTFSTGIRTGFANSSATNWSTGTADYRVILHCTSDWSHGDLIASR